MSHNSINRRTALKTFGGVAAGVGGFSYLGVARGGDFVEIPTVTRHGEVVETKRVPRKWYEHTKRAHRVLDNRRQALGRKRGVVTLGLSRSKEKFGGKNGSQISVGIDPESGAKENIPNDVDGIPVTTREVENIEPENSPCHGPGNPDPMPGGVYNQYVAAPAGTSCVKVADANDSSNTYMLSAAHNFRDDGNDCSEDIIGNIIYQESGQIGRVVDYSAEMDYAVYDKSESDITFKPEIYSDLIVNGQYTKWGVDDLKSDGDHVNKHGMVTGETEAVVSETGVSTNGLCWSLGGEGVKFSDTSDSNPGVSTNGDSGSPWYNLSGGYALMIGMHSAGTDEISNFSDCTEHESLLSTTAYAMPMYAIDDDYYAVADS